MSAAERPLLLGCGILAEEIGWLTRKNAWPVDVQLLNPALHVDLGALASGLRAALAQNGHRPIVLFYGMCHPLMERFLQPYRVTQVGGENCIEMLLGRERYQAELAQGAYFLLQTWTATWDETLYKTFGPDPALAREIFSSCQKYLLALRTPCAGDFSPAAEHAAASVELPLRWLDCGLDHLETALRLAIEEVL